MKNEQNSLLAKLLDCTDEQAEILNRVKYNWNEVIDYGKREKFIGDLNKASWRALIETAVEYGIMSLKNEMIDVLIKIQLGEDYREPNKFNPYEVLMAYAGAQEELESSEHSPEYNVFYQICDNHPLCGTQVWIMLNKYDNYDVQFCEEYKKFFENIGVELPDYLK